MKSNLTYQDKVDELKASFNHPSNINIVFVLVEGVSDLIFYQRLFNRYKFKVESFENGKGSVKKACKELGNQKIIGIIDADFCHITKAFPTENNVFLTDFHDIEIMLISDDDIFNFVTKYYLNEKLSVDIKSQLFDELSNINHLKLFNESGEIGFNFNGLSVVDKNKIKQFEQYCSELFQRSSEKINFTQDEIDRNIEELKNRNYDKYQITNGHDFLQLLTALIRKNHHRKDIKDKEVLSHFESRYLPTNFKKTQLFSSIMNWVKQFDINESKILASS